MPENSLFRTFRRFILAAAVFFGMFSVPLGYAAYSTFSASDYAAPRVGGTANMRSAMWNKVVDNVDDLQTRLLNFSFSSGNVGIGTATPGAKLEVAGQVKITGGTPGAGKALISDATGLASWSASAPLYAETDPKVGANTSNYVPKWNGSALVTGIIYDNATNVGIGTATPGYKLDVVGTSNFSQKLTAPYGSVNSTAGYSWTDAAINTTSIEIVNNAATVTTSSPTLAFHRYGTGGPQFRLDPAGTNVLYLESANAASARKPNAYGGGANSYFTRFHVDGQLSTSGNVGIGTTAPGAKLEVAGQVKITGGTPGVGKVLTSDATGLASWSASAPVYTEADPQVGANTTNYVPKWNGTALVAGTVFDNGTNVGIGTTTPNEKFDVNGAIQFRGTSVGYATTQSVGMIDFYNAGSRFLSFGANGTTRGIFSWYQAGQNNALGQESMRMDANGNLGVGTTAPGAKLEVAGQVKITGGTPGAGKVLTSDATGLASWSASAPVYTETDPEVGANTTSFVPRWNGTSLVAGTVQDNGTNVGIGQAAGTDKLSVTGNSFFTGDITVTGKVITDKLVNRTVNNVSISGSLLPDAAAPLVYRDIGSSAQRWNNLYLSGQLVSGVATGTAPFTVASTTAVTNLNADMVDGYHANAGVVGNNLVVRTAAGYVNTNYFNSTDDVSTGNISYMMAKFGDNYYRSATAAKVQSFLGLGSMAYQNTASYQSALGYTPINKAGDTGIGALTVTAPLTFSSTNLQMGRDLSTRNGISWYGTTHPSWSTYMSPATATTTGPHGDLTAPTGSLVTSWALRNYVENAAGYGWTFESAANTTTPSVVAEIRSSDGAARFGGNVSAPTFTSSVGVGTAPFTVTSTTAVTNLNADMVDGLHASSFSQIGNTIESAEITDATIVNADIAVAAAIAPSKIATDASNRFLTDAERTAWNAKLSSESDPQVGANTTSYVPKWNGTALVAGLMYDDGTKVGIGTATPGVKLHVQGAGNLFKIENTDGVGASQYAQMQLTAGSANNYIWTNNQNSAGFYGGSSALNIYTGQASPIAFFTNVAERMRIDSIGNVGIGTANPGYKLHVARTDAAGTYAYMGASSDGGARGLVFSSADSGIFLGAIHKIDASSAAGILTLATGGNERVRIDNSGNVGIGVTNPTVGHLQVQGTTAGAQIYSVSSATTGNNYGIDAEATGNGAASNIGVYAAAANATNNSALYIPVNYPVVGANNFAINSVSVAKSYFAGSVGIGTTAPGYRLDVQWGQINTSGGLCIAGDCKTAWNQVGGWWGLTGNAGTSPGTNFIGTTDDKNVVFMRGNERAGLLNKWEANTSWGVNALNPTTTGLSNTANGAYSLTANLTGNWNTANGAYSLTANTTGYNNVANGISSLYSNTTGYNNVANGAQSLYSNTIGTENVANGYYSLRTNLNGTQNVANGAYSLASNTIGTQNVANGHSSLYSNTTGNYNVANGYSSLRSNTTGNANVANGYSSLYSNTTGTQNVANGYGSLYSNIGGSYNVANGHQSLTSNTTGIFNVANGQESLRYNTIGNYNVANGAQSLFSNTGGINNVATGYRSLYSNTTGGSNVANGAQSLYSNTTGNNNVANGYYSLYSNTTGNNNVANGMQSLSSNTTGYDNVANGFNSLYSNTTGNSNVANGNSSLSSNTTGYQNVANGYQSLYANTTGYSNVANGVYSLRSNTTGTSNTANGTNSLYSNTTGTNNVANGIGSLYANTTGYYNTANGQGSLYANTTGYYNTANGASSLFSNTTGANNVANGYQSLYSNIGGTNNVANGVYSLYSNIGGTNNVANGFDSLRSNTTGNDNVANGYRSLYGNTTGFSNVANGTVSLLSNTTGHSNVANGFDSLRLNTTGYQNTANGAQSLRSNTTGYNNVANGVDALRSNTTGNDNVANGTSSLYANTTGHANTAIGNRSLYNLNLTGNQNGNNTAIGYNTGLGITTGVNNTILGANVTGLTAGLSNNIIIADGAGNQRINVDGSGKVGIGTVAPGQLLQVNGGSVLVHAGSSAAAYRDIMVGGLGGWSAGESHGIDTVYGTAGTPTTFTRIESSFDGTMANMYFKNFYNAAPQTSTLMTIQGNGNVGIGITAPTEKLDVVGNVKVSGNVTASAYYYNSDRNLKKNIVGLTGSLEKVTRLNGYSFDWKSDGRKDLGVIAQEVESVYPELVSTNATTGMKSVEYGNLVAPLIESAKELKRITDAQNAQIRALQEELKKVQSKAKN